ncbi:MAG: flagellar basal body P-ring formation chaperone FlgA [Gammaproteobacteria bacterium]
MNRVSIFRRVVARCSFAVALGLIGGYALAEAEVQSLDDVRSAAQGYVLKQVPAQKPGSVQVNVGALDSRLRLVACAGGLKAALPPGATFRARMTVAVSCGGPTSWTVYVPVSIETQTSVLVLRHAATRGARLSAQDVEVQMRTVGGAGDDYLTDIGELEGRTLKRPLGAGAAVTAEAMVADAVVKRGQQVTLLAAAGGMEVRARGVAMNDAPAAGRVKAQNLSSGRIVEGVVETADVIRITP